MRKFILYIAADFEKLTCLMLYLYKYSSCSVNNHTLCRILRESVIILLIFVAVRYHEYKSIKNILNKKSIDF